MISSQITDHHLVLISIHINLGITIRVLTFIMYIYIIDNWKQKQTNIIKQ